MGDRENKSTGKKKYLWIILIIAGVLIFFLILFGIIGIITAAVLIKTGSERGVQPGDLQNPGGTVTSTDPDVFVPDIEDADKENYTVFIYMVGTDLESKYYSDTETIGAAASTDIAEMAQCTYGEDVNVILQTGGCSNWAYDFLKDGEVQRFEILGNAEGTMNELASLGSVNMTETSTLSDFLIWGAQNYPAHHYALIFWDHGGGFPVSFGCDELYPGDMLSPSEIATATRASGLQFDFIGFDACLTGTMEMGYALKDCSNYLIGSETLEPGNGWDYSKFLTMIGQNPDADTTLIGKQIIDDYAAFYQGYGSGVNLSLIDLSQIENVVDCYSSYMQEWGNKIDSKQKQYSSLYYARTNCVEFPGTDSIDIVSLALQCDTETDEALIQAVKDAVSYTSGSMAYAYGIATFFPYGYPTAYATDVRQEMQTIGYPETIINTLDTYISLYTYYAMNSSLAYDFSAISSAVWYDTDTIQSYLGSGSDISSGTTEYGDFTLSVSTVGGQLVVPLSSVDWSNIARIETALYYETPEKLYVMGKDDIHWLDDAGNIVAEYPQFWLTLDAQTVYYEGLSAYKDPNTQEWYTYGQVYAALNGDASQPIAIILYFSNVVEDGVVLGYYKLDSATMESDGVRQTFAETDSVSFLYPYIDKTTNELKYEILGAGHQVNSEKFIPVYGPTYNFDNLVQNTAGMSQILVTDSYGQLYQTEKRYWSE